MHTDSMESSAFEQERFSKNLLAFCEDMRHQCRKMRSLTEYAQDYADFSGRTSLDDVANMTMKTEAVLSRMENLADRTEKEAKMLRDLTEIPLWKLEGNGDG